MGNQIIAEKFALLRTKGSNGIACTHLVEDTLTSQKAIVKISDKLGLLTLEYLKTINLIGAQEIPGILMPSEGGILEEENGYYFAFPELGEPSLENFLRIGVPFSSEEALQIIDRTLLLLAKLHDAGFYHLFVNTRNIFYRPGGSVTLKDPALKVEFFQPLLELIAAPDFSYFSPQVMDGQKPDAKADIYAAGRLAERLLEEVRDRDSSAAERLMSMAEKCRNMGVDEGIRPPDIRERIKACEASEKRETDSESKAPGATRQIEIVHECLDHEESHRKVCGDKPQCGAGLVRPFIKAILPLFLIAGLVLGLILAVTLNKQADEPIVNAAASGEDQESTANDFQTDAANGGDGSVQPEETIAIENSRQEAASTVAVEDSVGGEATGHTAPAPNPPAQSQSAAEESPAPPIASFSASPSSGQSPLQVYLDASSSYDPDGSIVSYSWSCGGQGKSTFHIFESNVVPTTIWVTLTLTDKGGHHSSTARQITLY